ncbi:MAG: Mur ligase family protein [Limnohabitans sp.]
MRATRSWRSCHWSRSRPAPGDHRWAGHTRHRRSGTRIHVAIFTNFTQDHLDYHGSMQAYWEAKRTLFDWPGLRLAVVNLDDPQGPALAAHLQARGSDLWTCSRHQRSARLFGHTQVSAQGLSMQVFEGPQSARLETALIGDYNLDNLLGVIAAQRACGVPLEEAVQARTALTPVPGRMQRVAGPEQSPAVVVDYAHTPDAVRQALSALEPLAQVRGGQLWCVLGCGGDRDPFKRPLMAAAAESGAARLVFTSDNPRSEAPEDILRQMVQGLQTPQAVTVIADRAEAIDWSVRHAAAQDVILLAGKGHETTQDIGGRLLPFSDMEQAGRALASRTNGVQEQAA